MNKRIFINTIIISLVTLLFLYLLGLIGFSLFLRVEESQDLSKRFSKEDPALVGEDPLGQPSLSEILYNLGFLVDDNEIKPEGEFESKIIKRFLFLELNEEELLTLLENKFTTELLLKDVKVLIHSGGIIDLSAKLLLREMFKLDPFRDYKRFIAFEVPEVTSLYLRGSVKLVGVNRIKVIASKMQIGKIIVPQTMLDDNSLDFINESINEKLDSIPHLEVHHMYFQPGKVFLFGLFPQEFYHHLKNRQ